MKKGRRPIIQAAAALAYNIHLPNFISGSIHRGASKRFCVPGLNCYSCPGAAGACPIGSLQAVIGGRSQNVSYYVVGTILLFGILFGRIICGFLCPFGFLQEMLYKIRSPKPKLPHRLDQTLRWGKYAALAAVLILPAVLTDAFGIGDPVFCKYICPAGTLEGGVPLLLANESLRGAVGWLFSWKMAVLLAVLVLSVLLYRPFCKYICPLGAAYGLLNRLSVFQLRVDAASCTHCGKCERACGMGVDIVRNINSAECIRCGQCARACPSKAISHDFLGCSMAARKRRKHETGREKNG